MPSAAALVVDKLNPYGDDFLVLVHANKHGVGEGVELPSPVLFMQKTDRSVFSGSSDNELWVICDSLITRYHTDKNQLEYLYGRIGYYDDTHCRWGSYAANSIAEDHNGALFIGTNIGVLRINHGQEDWLKPKDAEQSALPPDVLYAPTMPSGASDPFAE